jgi:hypothetical protein
MSTPVRGPDGPLGYAPRWARGSASGRADTTFDGRAVRSSTPVQELTLPQDLTPPRVMMSSREAGSTRDIASGRDIVSARDTEPLRDAVSERGAAPPRESASHWDSYALETTQATAPDSFWKRKKRPAVFEGDAALRELRSRLASAPDQTPEPPLYQAKTPIFAAVVRLVGVMVLAAGGALGFLWITAPRGTPPHGQVASQPSNEVALVTFRGLDAPKPPPAAEKIVPERAPAAPASGAPWAMANYSRDATEAIGTPPATLAPRVPAAAPRTPASRVTAPPPAAPAAVSPPPAAAVPPPAAAMPPPAAPVPAFRAPAPAVAAPVAVPLAPASAATASDRDEVAALLTRARTYLSSGDVAAARLVLRRAAERDDPQAALALGGTYDPTVLKRLGIINFHADPAQAREWYRRAVELGSTDASLRLDQLVQTDR